MIKPEEEKKYIFENCCFSPNGGNDWYHKSWCDICGTTEKDLIVVFNESEMYEEVNKDYYLCENCFLAGETKNINEEQKSIIKELEEKERASLEKIKKLENTIKELKRAIRTFNKVIGEDNE